MTALTIPRTGDPAAAPPGFAPRVLATEAGKGLRLIWRRRAVMISGIVLNGFLYLMIQFFIGGGHVPLRVLALTLPGLFAYVVAATAALQGSGGIAEEVNGGMFFGGMFIPVALFPHGIEIFARFIPTTLGTEVLNTTLAGRGLAAAWSDGTLPWLLAHVAVLAALGWVTYLNTLRRARREGGLSPR